MKKLILMLCFSISVSMAGPKITITYFNYDNYIFNSKVDFTVTLKNTGNESASNIKLMFIYTAVNGPNSYIDTTYANWGSTLTSGQTQQKTITIKLPKNHDVSRPTVTVFTQ